MAETWVVRSEDRDSFSLGGIEARVLVAGDATGGTFGIVESPIGPRVLAGPLHVHHKEDAFWYVMEGEFAAQVGDREIRESVGALIFAPRGVRHTYWNPASTPSTYLEIFWPAGIERYLEQLGRLVPEGGEDLLDRIGALSNEYGVEMDWSSAASLMEKHGLGFGNEAGGFQDPSSHPR